MKVYHGTIRQSAESIINNGILLSKSKKNLDFGKGFYTAIDIEFSIDTAYGKNKKANKNKHLDKFAGAVLEFEYDINKGIEMNSLSFDEIDISWAQFIINNRNGYTYTRALNNNFHNLDNKYDIVSGAIADSFIRYGIINSQKGVEWYE